MSNHIHLIWQPLFGFTPSDVQASFMKHTAQQLKRLLEENDKDILTTYKVNKYDRAYQIWKREPLGIELMTPAVFNQKLEYIHYNPVRAGLCNNAEDYYYSSAKYYYNGIDSFNMLTHYSGTKLLLI
jgi:putative transposase